MLIESAVSAGVNLIFFPELSLTGYEPEMAKDLALADESSLSPLQVLSDRYDMTIIVGAPLHVTDGKPAIGAFVISSKRPVSCYRKIYLHPGESDYFSAGNMSAYLRKGHLMSAWPFAQMQSSQYMQHARCSRVLKCI